MISGVNSKNLTLVIYVGWIGSGVGASTIGLHKDSACHISTPFSIVSSLPIKVIVRAHRSVGTAMCVGCVGGLLVTESFLQNALHQADTGIAHY